MYTCIKCNNKFERKHKPKSEKMFCGIKCMKSLEGLVMIYGEVEGTIKHDEYIDGKRQSLSKFIKKYGEEEGKTRWDDYSKSKAQTLENMIKRYGEEEGKKRWDDYKNKIKYKNSKDRYIKEFGEEEGSKKWDVYCSNRIRDVKSYENSCVINEENYIRRHGEEEGKRLWKITSNKKSKGISRNHYDRTQDKIPYFLYVMKSDFGIKIGIGKDVEVRKKQLEKDYGNLELLITVKGLYKDIRIEEKKIHEVFDINNLVLEQKKNGFTEWFDLSIEDKVIQLLSKKKL